MFKITLKSDKEYITDGIIYNSHGDVIHFTSKNTRGVIMIKPQDIQSITLTI